MKSNGIQNFLSSDFSGESNLEISNSEASFGKSGENEELIFNSMEIPPEIIDIREATTRLKIDRQFYFFTLHIFMNNAVKLINNIKIFIEGKHFEEARDFLHTLRGSTGNLAITNLNKASIRLNSAIKENKTDKETLTPLINDLENAFKQLFDFIQSANLPLTERYPVQEKQISFDAETFESKLSQLIHLLETYNYNSVQEATILISQLSAFFSPGQLEEFMENVNCLKFDNALIQLSSIKLLLKIL